MSTLSLELIEILDAIDRRGSFAAAAEELERVPSALSYTVQKYEEALKFSIFTRQGRRSVFTPAGRVLLDSGRSLLAMAGRITERAQTLASGWEPLINITIDSLLPLAPVMTVIGRFLEEHPGVEVDVREDVLGGAWESLIEDRVQLAIGAPAPKPSLSGIRAEELGRVERVFAVSPEHPLAKDKGALRPEDLAGHRLVVVHDSSRVQVPRNARLLNEDTRFYVQNLTQKIAAQKAGIGVGFVPRLLIEAELDEGSLVTRDVEEIDHVDRLYLAWKVSNRGEGLKRLVAMIKAAKIL
jgi:DNA-binding transcriptional LysR family regulator